jgi:hypothetical protein
VLCVDGQHLIAKSKDELQKVTYKKTAKNIIQKCSPSELKQWDVVEGV